jgi:hypothetical protein
VYDRCIGIAGRRWLGQRDAGWNYAVGPSAAGYRYGTGGEIRLTWLFA